ncbi:MAG: class I SAM-dependent DNA methyltransferase [bacterium]
MSEKPTGPSDFITEAYSLKDKESILKFYRKWSEDYDRQMSSQGYTSPSAIAELLEKHLLRHDIEVLDVGCGTGLTGSHVKQYGVENIDGIDISGEMISVARSRDIYRRLYVADLNRPLPLDDHIYDAAISSGTFTHGHVGAEPLMEIFRILRPGGLFACTIHFDLWHSRGFDSVLAKMIASNDIQCLALKEGCYFQDAKPEGWFCVYQKTL